MRFEGQEGNNADDDCRDNPSSPGVESVDQPDNQQGQQRRSAPGQQNRGHDGQCQEPLPHANCRDQHHHGNI